MEKIRKVKVIDGLSTVITSTKEGISKGYVLNNDFSTTETYVATVSGYIAHGRTVKAAIKAAKNKAESNLSVEDRVHNFIQKFPKYKKKYPAKSLYKWHHKLTLSCEFGRDRFCKENSIDLENDKFTIKEFIEKVENAYASSTIKLLKISYKDETD